MPSTTTNDLQQYIAGNYGITIDEAATVAAAFSRKTFAKGDFLLRTGGSCPWLGFVQQGWLRFYAEHGSKEVTQWISCPGHFVTDLASFSFNAPARWNIEALRDGAYFYISKEDYQNLGRTISGWAEIDKLFIARCFVQLENRVFGHLSQSAEERFQALFEQQPSIFNEVPLQYLASMMGMTPETLNRLRKKQLRS